LPDDPLKYGSFNQREQVKEADAVRGLVGVEKMQKYLETKKGVDLNAPWSNDGKNKNQISTFEIKH
jgi:hypothetical protein